MANPLFTILVVAPSTATFTANAFFRQSFRDRILNEFNAVAKASTNPKVQAGFNLEIVAETDARAGKADADLPKLLFRAVMVPPKFTDSDLLAKVTKLSPNMPSSFVISQMKGEGGAGVRHRDGSSSAYVSTSKFADALLLNETPNLFAEAGRQLGGLVCHELGHALGINQNQGKGVMYGYYEVNLESPTAISSSHFEPADTRMILVTLDGLAKV
jgi:hypothetical protein